MQVTAPGNNKDNRMPVNDGQIALHDLPLEAAN
jgi:hypothetical protein